MLSNNCLVNRRTAMRIMKVCNRKTCEVTLAYKCKNTLIPVQNDVFPKPPKRRLEPPEVPPRNVSLHTYVPTSTPKNSENMPCSPIVNRSEKHSFDKSYQSKRKIKRPTKFSLDGHGLWSRSYCPPFCDHVRWAGVGVQHRPQPD